MKYPKVAEKIAEITDYLPKDDNGNVIVPVDLGIILKKYALTAYDTTFKKSNVAGAFIRDKKEIYLDETDPHARKMFTLAHELGHYFLHDNAEDIMFREQTADTKKRQQMEKEADEFAAELLMPENVIRSYWTIAESVQQLATIFGVSYSAMLNRLRSLGYI